MRRLTSNDRHGVISCWIFANKPSSFRLLQYLCNGVFIFKIRQKLTSNEARNDDQVTIVQNRTMASKGVKYKHSRVKEGGGGSNLAQTGSLLVRVARINKCMLTEATSVAGL